MSDWIQWILTGLAPLCFLVAMVAMIAENRALRGRAEASEAALQKIADAIRDAAKRAQEKENQHE